MQTRPYIIWTASVTVILLFIVALWFMLGAGATIAPITSPSPSARASINQKHTQLNVLVEARLKLLDEMKISDDDYKMKVPIEFFGKVLDQHGGGVVGAKVEIGLCPPDDTGEKGHIIITGDDGRFSLTGTRGKLAFVNVYSPQGYTCGDMGHKGDYNYAEPDEFKFHVPDPDKPVVFRLWKYEKPEPLNRWLIDAKITNDGSIAWFDLNAGNVGGADVGVSFIGSSFIGNGAKKPEIRVVAGTGCGIWETRDDPMFIPPSSRGQAELKHEFVSMNKEYKDSAGNIVEGDPFRFRFYFRTANGCYSAVDADLSCGAGGVNPEMKLYVLQNPSGARNVEYDPRLVIKQ
jgi:hypothetical protein